MLKPVEQQNELSKTIAVKIGFVVLLVIAGIMLSNFKPPVSKSNKNAKNSPAVLGATIVNQAKSLGTRIQEFGSGTVKKVSSFVEEKKELAGDKASEFVYEAGVYPVLDKIKSLPEKDQEKIRKELCAPVASPTGGVTP